jgi:hypothetical protein
MNTKKALSLAAASAGFVLATTSANVAVIVAEDFAGDKFSY